jgi:reactive intermediate/imine deaminase
VACVVVPDRNQRHAGLASKRRQVSFQCNIAEPDERNTQAGHAATIATALEIQFDDEEVSMKHVVIAEGAPRPAGPYSHAVRAGDTIYLAGQGPFDPETNEIPADFEEQARLTFTNLERVARAAGSSLADAVRIGVYLKQMDDFEVMNRVYEEFVPEPRPARTTIPADMRRIDIEVDAVLYVEP